MFESCRAHFGVPAPSGSELANGTANAPAGGAAHLHERPLPERLQVDDDLPGVCVEERDQPDREDDHGEEVSPRRAVVRSRMSDVGDCEVSR